MEKRKFTKLMTTTFLVAGAALPMTVHANTASPTMFQDVYLDNPHAEAIHFLAERGVVLGDTNGYFHPAAPISVASALEMLERYLRGGEVDESADEQPETFLTYEEAALLLTDFIYTATGISCVEVLQPEPELFTQYGEPYQLSVAALAALQLPFQTEIAPQQKITRGEFAFLLYHVIYSVVETERLQQMLQLDDFLFEHMVFTEDGLEAFGKGAVPGTTITVRNMFNDVIGTSFVQRNGSYHIPVFPAVVEDERIALELKDEANNRSSIEKIVKRTRDANEPVIMDFIIGGNEEGPLVTSLERFLHIASAFPVTDEEYLKMLQDGWQILADWQASNPVLMKQLDNILYQLYATHSPETFQQVLQMLFTELKLIAASLPSEAYSKASWRQIEEAILQMEVVDISNATQIQQAYHAFAGLVTTFEVEQRAMEDGFQDLQETILAIEALLVPTSETGEDIAMSLEWTTAEERILLQQAMERALDVYIKFDPPISEILEAQNRLDLAIIRYEEAKQFGRQVLKEVKEHKQRLQKMMNGIQFVAVSVDGNDVYTNSQWTTAEKRAQLDVMISKVRQQISAENVTLEQLKKLQEQLLAEVQHYSSENRFGAQITVNELTKQLNEALDEAQQILRTVKGAEGGQAIETAQFWIAQEMLEALHQQINSTGQIMERWASRENLQQALQQLRYLVEQVQQTKQRGSLSCRVANNQDLQETVGVAAQSEQLQAHITLTQLKQAAVDCYEKK